MRSFTTVCIIAALVAIGAAQQIAEEEGVLVLTDDNFEEAINQYDPLLVEFYAPWCGHCKKLAPEYAKAAAALKKDGLRIAKLDATAHSESASKFDVSGYPTLKFFKGGKPTEYGGGRTETEIVNWVRKKSGPAAKTISTVAELEEFKASAEVVVVGVFKEGAWQNKPYLAAAGAIDDVPFAITTSDAIATELGVTAPAAVLFKDFDEGRVDFSEKYNEDNLKQFVNGNSLPLVVPFNQQTSSKIFGGPIKTHLLVFAEEGSKGYDGVVAAAKEVAKTVKGKFLVVTVGKGQDRVSQYFGVTKADLPTAAIVNMPEGGSMKKYLLGKNVVDQESLAKFVADYESGDLKPHLKTEEPPADNSAPVKVVVGKTFADIALDETKDVLLEFYAPWCGHCKNLAPIYDELAERFSSVKSIVVAKIDATANEVDHPAVNVRGFPTIKFFPAGAKKNNVIEYEGARDLAGLTAFLKEKATIKFTLPDEGAEADEEL